MVEKKGKADRVHSVRVSKELEEWVEKKIQSHEFGSWTHAIEWGLSLLKEKLENK
jgi:Arc/MetJ-type ribon-helix-helix transcriptional regulator